MAEHSLSHTTWNLGGVRLSLLAKGLREVETKSRTRVDIVSLQEVPRESQGWSFYQNEGLSVWSHREHTAWRGCGIAFRTSEWTVLRKKACANGIWCRLRRERDGLQVWTGSAYFSQGVSKDEHSDQVEGFLRRLPPTALPSVFGADVNTPFAWGKDDEELVAMGREGKGEGLLMRLRERGMQLTAPPPEQRSLPTCRPRKKEVVGRHIDVVGSKGCLVKGNGIVIDSHRFLSTDHDAVMQSVKIRGQGERTRPRPNTRPRRVTGPITVPEEINQQRLTEIAATATQPYRGKAYKDPEHVKVYFRVAREHNQPDDWKRALAERDKARRRWREERIEAACAGDWQAFRDCAKKGANGWESTFADAMTEQGKDPHTEVHEHFSTIYQGDPVPPFPFETVPRSVDFTEEDLEEALAAGRKGKSTGEDGVSHELLLAIAREPEGKRKLVEWFNRLLHEEEAMPECWARAVMVVLPKCTEPGGPGQLRPICLGCSASKVFSRLLLARTRQAFQYHGSLQNMGEGRQTVDHVWIIGRLMALEQEWKRGLWLLKIDIEKAFDSLNRSRFLRRLQQKLGCCEELRVWWSMFAHTEALLTTSWGMSVLQMKSGIRQGAVESPQVFSTAMDWIVSDVAAAHRWSPEADVYEGLELGETAFVDDCILWNGKREALAERMCELLHELREWGLNINAKKCQLYATPYVKDHGTVRVGEMELMPEETLEVMGVPFRAGIAPKEAMQLVFHKTRAKFWSLKHLFRAKTPLAGRLRLMQRVLAGTSLWCVAAFVPDKAALQAINVLQCQLVIWSMRLYKGGHESWVEFRMRSYRLARYMIQQHMRVRWGTLWLQRCWDYAGHRARGCNRVPLPGTAILDSYRTLTWWEREQGTATGKRHPGRFFPRLMTEERALNRAAGGDWREVAQNRTEWKGRVVHWLANHDLPWASFEQLALEE